MAEAHRSYRWQKMRATLLSRWPLCRKCRRPAAEIDHIVPVSKGGAFWDKGNLQALCRACHERKTARENRGPLPEICVHGWRSDMDDPCPDCGPRP